MREIHVGRLIDHVHLRASDLAAAKRFYRAVLGALGKPIGADDETPTATTSKPFITGRGSVRRTRL